MHPCAGFHFFIEPVCLDSDFFNYIYIYGIMCMIISYELCNIMSSSAICAGAAFVRLLTSSCLLEVDAFDIVVAAIAVDGSFHYSV